MSAKPCEKQSQISRSNQIQGDTTVKLKYSPAQQVRLAAISAQLQNADSSLPESSKDALRREALQIHKDVETKELLRLEQKADAKKARAEAKAAEKQARDAAKAAKDAADDDPPPPKPTLEDFDGDVDLYREEVELWQIELDERAAQKILDSPNYSLMVRDNANRKLRQCAQRRHALCPTLYGPDGELCPATPDAADSEESRRALLFKPFKSLHPKGTAAYKQEYAHWQQRYRLADEEAETRFRQERPEEWERHQKALDDDAERRANLVSFDHRGRAFDRFGHPIGPRARPTHDDGSFIASPLQEKVWGEQSREFARLRGETVDAPTPPAVVMSDRTAAYRLMLDGFLFWGDNTPCESPLPDGTTIINAPTPPYYRANDRCVPAGTKFDPINFVWVTTR
jgi:hypothetical protein